MSYFSYLNEGFAILHFNGKVSTCFIGTFIMLARSIAISVAPSLRNMTEIWSVAEDLARSKFFKILSAVVLSMLHRTKSLH